MPFTCRPFVKTATRTRQVSRLWENIVRRTRRHHYVLTGLSAKSINTGLFQNACFVIFHLLLQQADDKFIPDQDVVIN